MSHFQIPGPWAICEYLLLCEDTVLASIFTEQGIFYKVIAEHCYSQTRITLLPSNAMLNMALQLWKGASFTLITIAFK